MGSIVASYWRYLCYMRYKLRHFPIPKFVFPIFLIQMEDAPKDNEWTEDVSD